MNLKASTNVFSDVSLYTPVFELPYLQSAECKVTLYTHDNYRIAMATYLIVNTGMGLDVRLITGDDVFDPHVIRDTDQKRTILLITTAIQNAGVTAILDYSNRDNYFRPLFNQAFKKLSDFSGKDLTITKHSYQNFPSLTFGENWIDHKTTDGKMQTTAVIVTDNMVTVTIYAMRKDGHIGWDDKVLSGLPKPNLNSAGYYNAFTVSNNGHWYVLSTILNNNGDLVVEDNTFSYLNGIDKDKPINMLGTFSYPILN